MLVLALGTDMRDARADKSKKDRQSEKASGERIDARSMERRQGLLTFYVDRSEGRVWLELPAQAADGGVVGTFLHSVGLVTGLGSNPVGLDRGTLGNGQLVNFRVVGPRLLVEEPNLRYRALSPSPNEQRATRESFATSIIWAGRIVQSATGRPLVDITPFLVRDAHGIAAILKQTEQGAYKLNKERSVVDLEACFAFPDNLEFDALLTFTTDDPLGGHVRETTPSPEAITLVQHQSLVRLPDDGYRPRRFDPRAGSFAIRFQDYAASLDDSMEKRWIVRHRLHKTDPTAESSSVREPIVYYIDAGIPEPIRTAVIDGAEWWASAFGAAGFEEAFKVELLPAEAHPLDVRYNVIEWVHRSTRGWSYGGGLIDPRTGEMIKGHVRLGSLRVRQDRLLFEGLAGTEKTGTGEPDDPVELALARIRQLTAHEVGHTLGLAHNFAASTYGRASVMDYPAPLVRVTESAGLDFSQAYAVGVGAWDTHAVRYAYSEFEPSSDEGAALKTIVDESLDRGLYFITDQDARPAGAAQPLGNLWDNGSDPVAQLAEELAVRRIALARFGPRNVLSDTPLALLEEVLATVYFHHRYQQEAAVKVLGGVDYRYNLRGDSQPLARPISPQRQAQAVELILETLSPAELDLPDEVLEVLLPRPFGYGPNRELFRGQTSPVFDPLAAAATAADMTLAGLLQPERAARLVDQHRRDPRFPGFDTVLETVTGAVFGPMEVTERLAGIARAVQVVLVRRLLDLAADHGASPAVRAEAEQELRSIMLRLEPDRSLPLTQGAHAGFLAGAIDRFLNRVQEAGARAESALQMPPGSPIGASPRPFQLQGCSLEFVPDPLFP